MALQPAMRVGDMAELDGDSHGCPGCAHYVIGEAKTGSPNVTVNGKPWVREGVDSGVHSSCCGANTWVAQKGTSGQVFVNGQPVMRGNDRTKHCGSGPLGIVVEGTCSTDVSSG